METKEWDLREGDIKIPVNEVPPPPLRYAIVVQILSVEQPWALEESLVETPAGGDALANLANSTIMEKMSIEKTKIAKGLGEKDVAGKATEKAQKVLVAKDEIPKKSTKDGTDKNAAVTPMIGPLLGGEEPRPVSKASFSFQFPGAPLPPPEVGPAIGEALAPELPPPPWVPPSEPPEGDTDLDEPEELFEDPLKPPPPPPTTRFLNVPTQEFDVVSNYALWHKLLVEPLLITMYWTSPSGATRLPFARAHVDLFPVLALKGEKLEGTYKLEKIPEPPVVVEEEKPKKPKKGAKGGAKEKVEKKEAKSEEKDKKKTKKKKGEPEPEAPPQETLPVLLQGAELKIVLSTTNLLWSEDEISNGIVVEYDIGTVRNLPPKVVEIGVNPPAVKGSTAVADPFEYTLAIELPGFFGLDWWDDVKFMTPEEKAAVAQIRFEGGKVEVKEVIPVPQRKPSIIPPHLSIEEGIRTIRKAQEAKAIQDAKTWKTTLAQEAKERLEKMEHEELVRKLLHSETSFVPHSSEAPFLDPFAPKPNPELEPQAVLVWPNHLMVKRFLPSRAVHELKDLVKLGHHFRGEVARVVKPSQELPNTSFDKYHGCFFLDLSSFLQEGHYSFELRIPFQSYSLKGTRVGIPLIQPPGSSNGPEPSPTLKPDSPKPGSPKPTSPKSRSTSPKTGGKKQPPKPMPVDDDPPLPMSMDPDKPLPNNAWQLSEAFLDMKVQTSKPLEPMWKPPPEPEISLENVIPPRPKQASIYDAVQMALDKFAEFVEFVGADLLDMHQDLTAKELYEDNNEMRHPNAPKNRRFETKGEIRKKMVRQLQKQGLWNDIREEMKTKVLKVAAEKYRERKRAASDIGKFEFCNNLYISLSEVIFNTLKKMLEKRKCKKPDIVDQLTRLRQFADEYEAQEDYKSASRCHQERLLGDNLYDPDIWFEYGCYCMRVRPKDQGKAEECWREALTLKKNHLFSLQALGCLMWHRGCFTQAEVMFRNAINLHTEEEHINWVLVSQVYAAEGKKDNARSSLRRAEVLFRERRDSQNPYSPPHQLLSPLWRFPFSISYQSLSSQPASGAFVDTAMLLLDLHLPKEAELVLGLEVEIYSCTLDNKWCKARIAELNGGLEQAQNVLKEALKIEKENPTSWLLLGHMRYNYDPPPHYTAILQTNLYHGAIEAFNQYQRFLGDEEQYYKFVYLELGYSFFKLGVWEDARKVFLKGCTVIPTSPALWLAAGIAYFYAGNLNHAELALVEGNVLDTSNFRIWGYLTLTCLKAERFEEAEVSFQQGLKCIVDPDLLVIIAQGFAKSGNFRDAEGAYIESLNAKEAAAVRFQLAEMYFKEGKFPFAIPCYEKVVKAKDVTLEDRSIAISRLTEMQQDDGPDKPINRHLKDYPIEI